MGPLPSWIWPGPAVCPAGASSPPVMMMPRVGRGTTGTAATPARAIAPTASGLTVWPAASRRWPARQSLARGAMCCPAWIAGGSTMRSPFRSTCSTGTTASVPGGQGAPVMISRHSPGASSAGHVEPAGISPATGTLWPASVRRTAKPSIIARSNGGQSHRAGTSSARISPQASAKATHRGSRRLAVRTTSSKASSGWIIGNSPSP